MCREGVWGGIGVECSRQQAAGSGQRAAGSGQRAAGSGQRAAGSGQRAAGPHLLRQPQRLRQIIVAIREHLQQQCSSSMQLTVLLVMCCDGGTLWLAPLTDVTR